MGIREIKLSGMDWIDLAENRDQWRYLVNTVMNLQVPQNVGKLLSSCTTGAQFHGASQFCSLYSVEWYGKQY
jgi:hypothetical protein